MCGAIPPLPLHFHGVVLNEVHHNFSSYLYGLSGKSSVRVSSNLIEKKQLYVSSPS
jgi:hypothetical protein